MPKNRKLTDLSNSSGLYTKNISSTQMLVRNPNSSNWYPQKMVFENFFFDVFQNLSETHHCRRLKFGQHSQYKFVEVLLK